MDVDDDCADVLKDALLVARKEHTCVECSRVIRKGESYRNEKTVYDRIMTTYKTCSDCNSIRHAFICGGWYWGKILEAVGEAISDCGGDFSEAAVASLTDSARNRVCEMIERCWADR